MPWRQERFESPPGFRFPRLPATRLATRGATRNHIRAAAASCDVTGPPVEHVCLLSNQDGGGYKYQSKHVTCGLIRFTSCVPKYQLPPTVAASGRSQDGRGWGGGGGSGRGVHATARERPTRSRVVLRISLISEMCRSDGQIGSSPLVLFSGGGGGGSV